MHHQDIVFGDWYIPQKYENLKDESLHNNIYCLTNDQWQLTVTKSTLKWNSLKYINIVNGDAFWWSKICEIEEDSPITT